MNIYYDSDKFGLETVAEIDYSVGSYAFDTRVVWRHIHTGALFTARDSGCSCPRPFEDIELNDLQPVSLDQLRQEARDNNGDSFAAPFLEKVRAALEALP